MERFERQKGGKEVSVSGGLLPVWNPACVCVLVRCWLWLLMVTGNVIKTKASMLGCWLREAGPLAASLLLHWVCLCGCDVKRAVSL